MLQERKNSPASSCQVWRLVPAAALGLNAEDAHHLLSRWDSRY
ncbi:hypothetical protein ABZ646_17150 [Streptomyces sp. NPDC007162]